MLIRPIHHTRCDKLEIKACLTLNPTDKTYVDTPTCDEDIIEIFGQYFCLFFF